MPESEVKSPSQPVKASQSTKKEGDVPAEPPTKTMSLKNMSKKRIYLSGPFKSDILVLAPRKSVFNKIAEQVKLERSILLHGAIESGKTTFMRQHLGQLGQVVYISLANLLSADGSDFWGDLWQRTRVLGKDGSLDDVDVNDVWESADDFVAYLEGLKGSETPTVVAFDNVPVPGESRGYEDAIRVTCEAHTLGHISSYIVASSPANQHFESIADGKLFPVFLCPLSEKDVLSMLTKFIANCDKRLAQWVHALTGGHAGLVSIALSALQTYAGKMKTFPDLFRPEIVDNVTRAVAQSNIVTTLYTTLDISGDLQRFLDTCQWPHCEMTQPGLAEATSETDRALQDMGLVPFDHIPCVSCEPHLVPGALVDYIRIETMRRHEAHARDTGGRVFPYVITAEEAVASALPFFDRRALCSPGLSGWRVRRKDMSRKDSRCLIPGEFGLQTQLVQALRYGFGKDPSVIVYPQTYACEGLARYRVVVTDKPRSFFWTIEVVSCLSKTELMTYYKDNKKIYARSAPATEVLIVNFVHEPVDPKEHSVAMLPRSNKHERAVHVLFNTDLSEVYTVIATDKNVEEPKRSAVVFDPLSSYPSTSRVPVLSAAADPEGVALSVDFGGHLRQAVDANSDASIEELTGLLESIRGDGRSSKDHITVISREDPNSMWTQLDKSLTVGNVLKNGDHIKVKFESGVAPSRAPVGLWNTKPISMEAKGEQKGPRKAKAPVAADAGSVAASADALPASVPSEPVKPVEPPKETPKEPVVEDTEKPAKPKEKEKKKRGRRSKKESAAEATPKKRRRSKKDTK